MTPVVNSSDFILDLFMPSVTVPTNFMSSKTDPYVCYDLLLPTDQAYHITSYEAVINTSGGSQSNYVHHMLLFICSGAPSTFGQRPYDCTTAENSCNVITLEAASKPFVYPMPPDAGFRIGLGGMSYVVLQVHYNNLAQDHPVDNSGFRLHVTPMLRPYDMGVLVLGWEFFKIPKKSMAWSAGNSICPTSCTNKFKGPIQVIKNPLHMHKLGSRMITRHARQDVDSGEWAELRPTAELSYYDFNFQTGIQETSAETATFLPGDSWITNCEWNNPGSKDVNYGRATSDEMCYSYINYYPLENTTGITRCTSIGLGFTDSLGLSTCYDESKIDIVRMAEKAAGTNNKGSSLLSSMMRIIQAVPEVFVQSESYIPELLNPPPALMCNEDTTLQNP